jgi:hypothetical protein
LVLVNCENWPIHPRLTLPQKECSIYNGKEVITFHQSIDGTTAERWTWDLKSWVQILADPKFQIFLS